MSVFTLLAIVALLYRLVIFPGYKCMNTALFHLSSQQDLLQVRAEEMRRFQTLTGKIQKLKASMAETNNVLFSKDEATGFLKLLPGLVNQTGSVLINMLPHDMKDVLLDTMATGNSEQEPDARRSYMHMPVQIAIRGEYDEIVNFLQRLEEREQLIDVSELSIATAVRSPAEVDASFTINLYVYENQEI